MCIRDRDTFFQTVLLALTRHPNILITPLRGDLHIIRTPDYWSPHPIHHPCVLALWGSLFWDRVGYPRGWVTFPGSSLTGRPSWLGNLDNQRPTRTCVPHPALGGTREAGTNLPDPEVNLPRSLDSAQVTLSRYRRRTTPLQRVSNPQW